MKICVLFILSFACLTAHVAHAQADPNAKPAPVSTAKSPPAPATTLDGKVTGLNAQTYAALKAIKSRNPGAMTEANAKELKAAVLAEGGIDAVEHDLLDELVQSQFRSITIVPEKEPTGEKLISYPVAGNAKQTLINTLNPPADLDAEWAKGQPGWQAIVRESQKSLTVEAAIINFLQGKLAPLWENSNMQNAYKPLRDQIAKLYSHSNSLPAAEVNGGKMLLYKAMNQLDRGSKDQIPDFLYNWVRPGGSL